MQQTTAALMKTIAATTAPIIVPVIVRLLSTSEGYAGCEPRR